MTLIFIAPASPANLVGPGCNVELSTSLGFSSGDQVTVLAARLPVGSGDALISTTWSFVASAPFGAAGPLGWNLRQPSFEITSWSTSQHDGADGESVYLHAEHRSGSGTLLESLDTIGFTWSNTVGLWTNMQQMRFEIAGSAGGAIDQILAAVYRTFPPS